MAPIVNTISDDSETGAIFSQPPLISIQMRQKPAQATFWSEVHFKLMTNLELSNTLAHDAKVVLSFTTRRKFGNPRDPSRSLIILRAPPPMSYIHVIRITCTYCKKLYIGETGSPGTPSQCRNK